MKSSSIVISLAVAALGFQVGCSAIRVVKTSKAGGEIALLGGREGAMEKAREEMSRNCGGTDKYEVVEEGEATVGSTSTTSGTTQKGTSVFGNPQVQSSGTTETTDKREWRVKYACKGVTDPAAAAPAAAPPAVNGATPAPAPAPAPAPMPKPQGKIYEVRVYF